MESGNLSIVIFVVPNDGERGSACRNSQYHDCEVIQVGSLQRSVLDHKLFLPRDPLSADEDALHFFSPYSLASMRPIS